MDVIDSFNLSSAEDEIVYLNYAATSFPKSKIALDSFFKAACSLPEGSRQSRSNIGLREFKRRVGKILETNAENIFFTTSATIGLNQVIKGFVKQNFCLAIDNRSHNSVVRPWTSLAAHCQCIVAHLYDEQDQFLEAGLDEILAKSPNLLCLTHVSNVNGSIYPVEKIIALVRSRSPTTSILIDASQSAGVLTLSSVSKADFVVFPSHKHLHSLPGAAVVVVKKRLDPIIFGGTGENSMAVETLGKGDLFAEVGTMNFPAINAMVDSLEFADAQMARHSAHENSLVAYFMNGIHQIEGLRITGRDANAERIGVVALIPEFGSAELHWAPFLASQKIYVRGGLHCSPLHHQQLGLTRVGTLRFSFGWNSTFEHLDKAIIALKKFSNCMREAFDDSLVRH